ncbi:exported protein of unknown function [Candidatus Nitrosocosmicus arcticus]|uniref:Uncharacterized protein n=2 Tax=Candidatus Nitrosocosmicus arcticus TaxID=2035267 RepID=A0A557SYJ2_9ARCH|nr:exported protein of unknown function [Candidatus Nitrosocosmicus arcticus]
MSMTSTKSFSTKNAGVLVAAVFSLTIAIGLSQVSSAMALNDLLNCNTEVGNESSDFDMKDATSCNDKVSKESENLEDQSEMNNDAASSNDDEGADERNGVESKTNSVLTAGPAVASPDDNIIKPINLNKGTESDEPLETNNDKNKMSAESVSKQIFEDEIGLSDQLDTNTNTDVSELYKSFDLPYTAIYKNQ